MPRTPKPRTIEELADLVEEWVATKEQAKLLYARADEILLRIARRLKKKSEPIPLSKERTAQLINQFSGKTLLWGHAAVRKWDLEISKSAKPLNS